MNLIILPIAGWREVFVFCGVLGAVCVILVWTCMDESPRWLALNGHNDKADAIVSKLEAKAAAGGKTVEEVTVKKFSAVSRSKISSSFLGASCLKRKLLPVP